MKSPADKLLERHAQLTHSEMLKVTSHVQRKAGEWIINTVMVEGCDVAFKYRRRRSYKNLTGGYVNMTYYPAIETVAGIDVDIMKVVRIKRS